MADANDFSLTPSTETTPTNFGPSGTHLEGPEDRIADDVATGILELLVAAQLYDSI